LPTMRFRCGSPIVWSPIKERLSPTTKYW
jgi:hypothetical protein